MGQPSWRFAGNERNSGKLFFRFVGYAALSVALMILDSRLAAVQYIRQAASVVLTRYSGFPTNRCDCTNI